MSFLKPSTTMMTLLSLPSIGSAWVVIPLGQTRQSPCVSASKCSSSLRRTTFVHHAGPFFGPEEEFSCPDEEECEIDWDLMPGFEEESNAVEQEDESDVDLQPRQNFGSQALNSLANGRVRLEMSWQIDECETDRDSCSDFCPDCAGSGQQPCRFCRGTGIVSFGKEFRPCLICSHAVVGQENCSSCRGTGKIAPWASTLQEHFKRNERLPKTFL